MKRIKSYMVVAALAAASVVVVATIDYPSRDFIIGHSELTFDVVEVTQYIDVWGVVITSSHVKKARITCVDVTIQPATIFQTCRNTKY